jgi:RNA 2',3'-cyclic 3'-phosphodiesterase
MDEHLQRWLYLMAKPTPRAIAYIAGLARKDRRALDLAHVTLLVFADLERRVAGFLDEVLEALRGFEADAFHVGFNRIVEGRCVTLRSRRLQRDARDFQAQLTRFLRRRGFDDFREPPDVHLTINYHRDRQANQTIPPFDWCVDEILLIESVYGKSRHIVHGRWPLLPLLL